MATAPGSDGGWTPIDRRPTSDVIADELRRRIVEGDLAPGTQLGEVALAERLEVSRGPVREALQRLVQEGLAMAERHRGVFVATLDEHDAADVYVARAAVERSAALALLRRGDAAAVDHLADLVEQMRAVAGRRADGSEAAATGPPTSWRRLADLDLAFHEALVDAAGSRRLTRMYGTLVAETRMVLAGLEQAHPDGATVVAEHERLVEALRRGDEAEVLAAVDDHLQHATARRQAAPEVELEPGA